MGASPPRGAGMRGRGPGREGVPGLVGRVAPRTDHHGVADDVGPGRPRDQREGTLTAQQLDPAEAEEERPAPGIVGLAAKRRPSRSSRRRHDTEPLGDHLVHGCRTPPLHAKADRPESLVESPPRQAHEVGPRPPRGIGGRGPTGRGFHGIDEPWCPQLPTAQPSVRQGLPWTGSEPLPRCDGRQLTTRSRGFTLLGELAVARPGHVGRVGGPSQIGGLRSSSGTVLHCSGRRHQFPSGPLLIPGWWRGSRPLDYTLKRNSTTSPSCMT